MAASVFAPLADGVVELEEDELEEEPDEDS
jgi:hypothetical protein